MSNLYGVDLSVHNGNVNFKKLSYEVDFVMLRGGYSKTIDEKFLSNAKDCEKHGIPYGIYWFSYAFTAEEGKSEAKYCLEVIKENNLKPALPIAFDYEEGSYNYAKSKGQDVSPENICSIANAFLTEVKAEGYKELLYTNVDYYNRIFYSIVPKYHIWLAQWGVSKPCKQCDMWQSSSTKKFNGIQGEVDYDIAFYNYLTKEETDKKEKIKNYAWEKYLKVANEIINGKYGNGEERKNKLKQCGLDYELAQDVVNYLIYG